MMMSPSCSCPCKRMLSIGSGGGAFGNKGNLNAIARRTVARRLLLSRRRAISSGVHSDKNNKNNSNNNKKKKRRKPIGLSDREFRVRTTKDRIRRVADRNQVVVPSAMSSRNLSDLWYKATGRLSWVENQLYTYWDPDYNKTNNNNKSKSIEASSTSSSSSSGGRGEDGRRKRELVMDRRWWFWNMALALTPATLIALYCEFRLQFLMYDYQRDRHVEELRRVMGDRYVDENADAIEKTMPDPPRHIQERLRDLFAVEIPQLVNYLLAPSKPERDGKQQQQQQQRRPRGGSGIGNAAAGREQEEARQSPSTSPSPSIRDASKQHVGATDRDAVIRELLERISNLESKVVAAHNTRGGVDRDDDDDVIPESEREVRDGEHRPGRQQQQQREREEEVRQAVESALRKSRGIGMSQRRDIKVAADTKRKFAVPESSSESPPPSQSSSPQSSPSESSSGASTVEIGRRDGAAEAGTTTSIRDGGRTITESTRQRQQSRQQAAPTTTTSDIAMMAFFDAAKQIARSALGVVIGDGDSPPDKGGDRRHRNGREERDGGGDEREPGPPRTPKPPRREEKLRPTGGNEATGKEEQPENRGRRTKEERETTGMTGTASASTPAPSSKEQSTGDGPSRPLEEDEQSPTADSTNRVRWWHIHRWWKKE